MVPPMKRPVKRVTRSLVKYRSGVVPGSRNIARTSPNSLVIRCTKVERLRLNPPVRVNWLWTEEALPGITTTTPTVALRKVGTIWYLRRWTVAVQEEVSKNRRLVWLGTVFWKRPGYWPGEVRLKVGSFLVWTKTSARTSRRSVLAWKKWILNRQIGYRFVDASMAVWITLRGKWMTWS